eukprot:5642891-Pleurochrysis_carterae.AAC.2
MSDGFCVMHDEAIGRGATPARHNGKRRAMTERASEGERERRFGTWRSRQDSSTAIQGYTLH